MGGTLRLFVLKFSISQSSLINYYPGWLAISSSGELSNEPPSTALWSPFTPLFAGMLIVCEMWAWLRGLRRAVEFRGKCWHVLYPVGIFIIMCEAVYL